MSAPAVTFLVVGTPAPQGSLTVTRQGNYRPDNPKTQPWRNAVAAAAAEAMNGRPPLTGPLRLRAGFRFPRVAGHYGTGRNRGALKPSAPHYCAKRPDLDKLLRAVGDAITGIVCHDDAQLVEIHAAKVYGQPGMTVAVEVVDNPDFVTVENTSIAEEAEPVGGH